MPVFQNLSLPLGADLDAEVRRLDPSCHSWRLLRSSLDARKKGRIQQVYTVETFASAVPPPQEEIVLPKLQGKVPTVGVIGAGPAGLFAALRLRERGINCFLLERGRPILQRMRDISKHWKTGDVHPDSNVCFGEGGAGTFSDGKLITRIRSEHIPWVMRRFVTFGAPEEILWLANPHVGSNRIRKVIAAIAAWLEANECPVFYDARAEDFTFSANALEKVRCADGREFAADAWILATGHSAHDIYAQMLAKNVPMEAKSMAMGFRVEHPQAWLNQRQYGPQWQHPELPAANYRLAEHDHGENRGVYSFCMCPGGYVLASTAQQGRMVVNGMSNYGHGSPFANSGIVVSIDKDRWLGNDPMKALAFQEGIERATQELAKGAGAKQQVPAQMLRDFLKNRGGAITSRSSCPSGVVPVNMRNLYPKELEAAFCEAMEDFDRKLPGFTGEHAVLHGIESRTSSPVRIVRDDLSLASPRFPNLYPAGEGAGYAGGITSAAVDGVKLVEAIIEKWGKS